MASSSPETVDSYTQMDPADLEAIGAHCAFCRQKDFLPWRCESCGQMYCLEHRTESSHYCTKTGAWAGARADRLRTDNGTPGHLAPKPTIYNHEDQCSEPRCKELLDVISNVGVHCSTCNRRYCWKHRMPEDHDCKNLTPIGARPTLVGRSTRERGLAALAKLRAWSSEKKQTAATISIPIQSKSSVDARLKRQKTNELKQTAKGDAKWKEESRIYVWLIGATDAAPTKWPKARAFYPRDFNSGRVLDLAAKELRLQNNNNRVTEESQKLRILHLTEKAAAGKVLQFDAGQSLGSQGVDTGHTLVIFKGSIPAITDVQPLMEM